MNIALAISQGILIHNSQHLLVLSFLSISARARILGDVFPPLLPSTPPASIDRWQLATGSRTTAARSKEQALDACSLGHADSKPPT